MQVDLSLLAVLAGVALGLPFLMILRYNSSARKPMSPFGVKVTFAVCAAGAAAIGAWSFVPLKILLRAPNADGSVEAVIAQTQPGFGSYKVLIRVPGDGGKTSEQVLMVDDVQPALGLRWRGNQLIVSAQRAGLLLFDPEVDIETPRGPVHVSVHTNVAYWTPSSTRTGQRYPGQ
jgi:hypothetical protein